MNCGDGDGQNGWFFNRARCAIILDSVLSLKFQRLELKSYYTFWFLLPILDYVFPKNLIFKIKNVLENI